MDRKVDANCVFSEFRLSAQHWAGK
jgi:hypothetical protein